MAAGSGLLALITIALFFAVGQPFGTLNDLSLLVMTLAIAPIMLGFYELGGRTPIGLARLSLAGGIGAVVVWSIVQTAMIVGVLSFDYGRPAIGAYALESIALLVIGAWLAGANPLAGPWLRPVPRWLGMLSGLGFIGVGVGLILGGITHPLTYIGGIGYQVLFPLWAVLIGRTLFGLDAVSGAS
ncbi:MAG TPA: hypothetical protein VIM30_07850 [Candidatus Limnocylindrales bacterium]